MAKFCSECGHPVEGAVFCSSCGKKIGSETVLAKPPVQSMETIDIKGIIFMVMTVISSVTLLFNWLTVSFLGNSLGFNCFNTIFKVEELWDEAGAKFVAFILLVLACLVVIFSIITCKNVLQKKEADKWFYNTNVVGVILSLFGIFVIFCIGESEGSYFEAFYDTSAAPYILLVVSIVGFIILNYGTKQKENTAVMSAYSEFLHKVLDTGNANKFELINIDNDNIPELVIYMEKKDLALPQVKIYSYYADKIKCINKDAIAEMAERNVTWGYKEGQSEICQRNNDNNGCSIDSIYIVSPTGVFRNTVATNEFGSVFTINGVTVTEQAYKLKFDGFKMLDGANAYDINETNILSVFGR